MEENRTLSPPFSVVATTSASTRLKIKRWTPDRIERLTSLWHDLSHYDRSVLPVGDIDVKGGIHVPSGRKDSESCATSAETGNTVAIRERASIAKRDATHENMILTASS